MGTKKLRLSGKAQKTKNTPGNRDFSLPVAGFEEELRHRNRCEDARFLLVGGKQCLHTFYNIRLEKRGERRSLCSLCSGDIIGTTAESRRDLLRQITHPGIHPVAGTAFVCEPPMDGKHHLAGLRLIGESFVLIAEPEQFRLAVALADVHAQLDLPA